MEPKNEKPKRTHQPHWQDTTRTERSRQRRAALDDLARKYGFPSWSALETAALKGQITFVVAPPEK